MVGRPGVSAVRAGGSSPEGPRGARRRGGPRRWWRRRPRPSRRGSGRWRRASRRQSVLRGLVQSGPRENSWQSLREPHSVAAPGGGVRAAGTQDCARCRVRPPRVQERAPGTRGAGKRETARLRPFLRQEVRAGPFPAPSPPHTLSLFPHSRQHPDGHGDPRFAASVRRGRCRGFGGAAQREVGAGGGGRPGAAAGRAAGARQGRRSWDEPGGRTETRFAG